MKRRLVQIPRTRRQVEGLSLIEMMVALLLGLLVVSAAIGIFISNQQAYRATESLGRVQENTRMAFEVMARNVREAGGNVCNSSNTTPMINLINTPANRWWSRWGVTPGNVALGSGLLGVDAAAVTDAIGIGGNAADRVAGTPALITLAAEQRVATVVSHTPANQTFTVQNANHGFQMGDVLVVCGQDSDMVSMASAGGAGVGTVRMAGLFQMTNAGGGTTIRNAVGGTPGNASSNLGPGGSVFTYGPNASISRVQASVWYVGNGTDPANGRSLYQLNLTANGGTIAQEIIQGVDGLTLTYLLPGANQYVAASAVPVARWPEVTAVRIDLTLRANVGGGQINRNLVQIANLRNRSL